MGVINQQSGFNKLLAFNMESLVGLLQESIESLEEIIKKVDPVIEAIDGQELPRPTIDEISKYSDKKQAVEIALNNTDENKSLEEIQHCAMYSFRVAQNIQRLNLIDINQKFKLDTIIQEGQELKKKIQHRPATFNASNDSSSPLKNKLNSINSNEKTIDDLAKKVEALSLEMQRADERFRQDSNETVDRINVTSEKAKSLEGEVEKNISNAKDYFENAVSDINAQRDKLNELIGEVSGDKVAKSYEESSKIEKRSADWLRRFSIVFMLLIAGIVTFSFWETTQTDFKWETSAFRIVIAFFLTVPSAYLARESAKHREQQYNHLQTSLTIRAIDPYISTLPEAIKHDVKKEISGHIFGKPKNTTNSESSFPINNQEIIIELIKKIDLKASGDKKANKAIKSEA